MSYHYRVYPDKAHKYHICLWICRTQRIYDRRRKEMGFVVPQSMGCFAGNWIGKKYKKARPLGEMFINLKLIDNADELANVVAHECTHAAVHYMKATRQLKKLNDKIPQRTKDRWAEKDPEQIPEERLCYAVGRLVAQVTRALKQDKRYKT